MRVFVDLCICNGLPFVPRQFLDIKHPLLVSDHLGCLFAILRYERFYSIILCFADTVKFHLLILVLFPFQFLLFFLKTLQEMDFYG